MLPQEIILNLDHKKVLLRPSETTITMQSLWQLDCNSGDSLYRRFSEPLPFNKRGRHGVNPFTMGLMAVHTITARIQPLALRLHSRVPRPRASTPWPRTPYRYPRGQGLDARGLGTRPCRFEAKGWIRAGWGRAFLVRGYNRVGSGGKTTAY